MTGKWKSSIVALMLLTAGTAVMGEGQTLKEFDVASIKLNPSGDEGYSIHTTPGGRLTIRNATISTLIQLAYNVQDFQISDAPGWTGAERYDVDAKADTAAKLTEAQLRTLCRSLLTSRFHFTFHRKTRQVSEYFLVAAKKGLKLQANTGAPGPEVSWNKGRIDMINVPVASFASVLARQLGRNVVDNTGATGNYDFRLTWAPDQSDATGPSIFTALQEQYGLRVESRKGPVEVIAIDGIDRPSEN